MEERLRILAITVLGIGGELDVYKSYQNKWMATFTAELVAMSLYGIFGHPRTRAFFRFSARWFSRCWRGTWSMKGYIWQAGRGNPPVYTTLREKGENFLNE
jgi:hypothetical protein